MRRLTIIISLLITWTFSVAQQGDSINRHGFYIPKNVGECVGELDKILTDKAKRKFKQLKEDDLDNISGIFVMSDWYGNYDTRLADYFKQRGVDYWMDWNKIIYNAYHSHLNGRGFNAENEIRKVKIVNDSLKIIKQQKYESDLKRDSIDGIYIPTDIEDCIRELNRILSQKDKEEIAKSSDGERAMYHMSIGLWMRNNWGLWGGSRLKKYFLDKGVNHPDNMSGIILSVYYKSVTGQKYNVPDELKRYKEDTDTIEQKVIIKTIDPVDEEKMYTDKYRQFLKSRKIDDFQVYRFD